jgi:hypothetical protein
MSDGGATARDGMNHFGQQLRAERERQSLLLGQVSKSIRVREQYLDASSGTTGLRPGAFTRG